MHNIFLFCFQITIIVSHVHGRKVNLIVIENAVNALRDRKVNCILDCMNREVLEPNANCRRARDPTWLKSCNCDQAEMVLKQVELIVCIASDSDYQKLAAAVNGSQKCSNGEQFVPTLAKACPEFIHLPSSEKREKRGSVPGGPDAQQTANHQQPQRRENQDLQRIEKNVFMDSVKQQCVITCLRVENWNAKTRCQKLKDSAWLKTCNCDETEEVVKQVGILECNLPNINERPQPGGGRPAPVEHDQPQPPGRPNEPQPQETVSYLPLLPCDHIQVLECPFAAMKQGCTKFHALYVKLLTQIHQLMTDGDHEAICVGQWLEVLKNPTVQSNGRGVDQKSGGNGTNGETSQMLSLFVLLISFTKLL